MKTKILITYIIIVVFTFFAFFTFFAKAESSLWKFTSSLLQPVVSTWSVYSPDDFRFDDEILPDGDLCSNGQVLQKTGADDWDCVTIAGSGDVTSVGDCASGACFDGTQGTTLTFNNAGGDGTLVYDGTDFAFSHLLDVTGGITASGLITANALLTIGNGATTAGVLKLLEDTDNGSNTFTLTAPAAITSNIDCLLQNDSTPFDNCITAGAFDATAQDALTWSDGLNASNIWTFDLSGTDTNLTFASALFTFSHGITLSAGNITQAAGTTLFMGGLLDAVGAVDMDYGSADITDHTFITDGTGDAEIVLPVGSISLAETAMTAGRSLTISTNDVLADAELYTDTKTIWFENPTSADDFKTIWTAPLAVTITKISCESDQTVNFDLQVDDGSATGVNGSDIACTTFATDSTLAGDTTLAAGDRLDLAITSVSGTPTWVSISFEFTYDD